MPQKSLTVLSEPKFQPPNQKFLDPPLHLYKWGKITCQPSLAQVFTKGLKCLKSAQAGNGKLFKVLAVRMHLTLPIEHCELYLLVTKGKVCIEAMCPIMLALGVS